MKKPVTYCNSQDDRFAGSAALLVAVTFTSVSLLSLSVGYPARLGSILLLVVSFIVTGLSYTYLTHITGRLRISERGIDYLPEQGGKTSFSWKDLARIRVLPGWLSLYDREGGKVLIFTYGPGKQHTLIRLFSQFTQKCDTRPEIWPGIEPLPRSERAGRKKSGAQKKKRRSGPVGVAAHNEFATNKGKAAATGASRRKTSGREKPGQGG